MLVTCSIGRTSHQSLILYMVARLDTRWRDIEDGNGLPVTRASQLCLDDRRVIRVGLVHRPAPFTRGRTQGSGPGLAFALPFIGGGWRTTVSRRGAFAMRRRP